MINEHYEAKDDEIFLYLVLAQSTRQPLGATGAWNRADLDFWQAKLGILSGIDHVTLHVPHKSMQQS